jgi:spore coat polysaccharide biosynthesis protein SpsF (cytidylyltransferase family)
MIPVLKTAKAKGDLVNLKKDLIYRRSGQQGLSLAEISNLQQQHQVLATQVDVLSTLRTEHFRKARIGAIVACRMKSSRLKAKAILPIGDLPSVQFCLRNVLRFQGLDAVILATSTVEEDAVLSQHTFDSSVLFFRGHPEDVMQRYIDACTEHQLDVIVRITADMPFIDNALFQFILKEHFESGADYTVGEEAAVGVNLEIFNVACLQRIKKHFPSAEYSEYMTWYFQNNPEHVTIHKVKLPEIFVRNYRLTLDYEEDLALLNHVHEALAAQNPNYALRDIISFLDEHPEVAAINQHLSLRYKTDQALIDLLNEKTKIRG